MIGYMRDHRVDDGLEYVATWNATMLQSADLRVAMTAHMSKQSRNSQTDAREFLTGAGGAVGHGFWSHIPEFGARRAVRHYGRGGTEP